MTASRSPDPPLSRRELRMLREQALDAEVAVRPHVERVWDDLAVPDWVAEAGEPERYRSSFVPSTRELPIVAPEPIAAPEPIVASDDAPVATPAPSAPHDSPRPHAPRDLTVGESRREARALGRVESRTPHAQHLRDRRAAGIKLAFSALAGIALAIGGAAAITAAVIAPPLEPSAALVAEAALRADPGAEPGADPGAEPAAGPLPQPQMIEALPAPTVEAAPAPADICAIPAVVEALAAVDDAAAIAAAGGAEAFRTAVASGTASCVSLSDPAHVWVVVNKARPYDPIDFRPSPLMYPAGVWDLSSGDLRQDAAAALAQLVGAASSSGAGRIALDSGFRSYGTQRSTYNNQVAAKGTAGADLVSARPGYSEHQSGLAADVTACSPGCVDLGDFAGTPQQKWVAAHAWEFGWIVRYEEGMTAVTGYSPEPWHLRYIGRELAKAYHDGGWRSLEEFFGVAAAPDYAG